MAAPIKTPRMMGQPIKRREDPRLITGAGQYLDDITFPGLLHLAVVRSPYGHARVNGIDASAALKLPGDVEGAFRQAHKVVKIRVVNQRVIPAPMEMRGALAIWRPDGAATPGELTLYETTQNVHGLRKGLAPLLGYPENKVRVIVPDMGGGFGNRADCAPETVLACIAAKRLGRPVKYQETRTESNQAAMHGRGQTDVVEGAVTKD